MPTHFDIAVMGSGPGGYVAALKAAQSGAKTAVVEAHPFHGGTCLNWGCIPSKALLASAELLHKIEHAKDMGVTVDGNVSFDWTAIQKRKDKVIRGLRGGIKSLFAARNVTAFHGRGVLDGKGKIVVKKEDGSTVDSFTAGKIILAVGSLPSRIPGWPADPELVCTSDESLHWKSLPKKLLIVGGGIIGCEFACMMRAFGVEVTVVELLPKLLAGMDTDLVDAFTKVLKSRGVTVHLDTKVEALSIQGKSVSANLGNGESITCDRVLAATGRTPNTENLGLETVGIERGPGGFIKVDDKMETSAKGIYCIGDANGRTLLAHAASAQGIAAAGNALGHEEPFNAPIPSTVYTFPEMAAAGLTQEQAEEAGLPIGIGKFPIGHLGKALAAGETDGFVKVIKHRETGKLLGVHMIGHNVTEIIASAGALLHQHASVKDVAETVFAHPTISEAFKEAAEDALHMAVHLPPKKMMRAVVTK